MWHAGKWNTPICHITQDMSTNIAAIIPPIRAVTKFSQSPV